MSPMARRCPYPGGPDHQRLGHRTRRLYAEDPYRKLPALDRAADALSPPAGSPPVEAAGNWVNDARAATAPSHAERYRRHEGGEISMFYDPMIAALHLGPDRAGAIEAMRLALDQFEVEGIGHNLPFLSA